MSLNTLGRWLISNKFYKCTSVGFEPRTARFEVQVLVNYLTIPIFLFFTAIIHLLLVSLNMILAASHCRLLAAKSILIFSSSPKSLGFGGGAPEGGGGGH